MSKALHSMLILPALIVAPLMAEDASYVKGEVFGGLLVGAPAYRKATEKQLGLSVGGGILTHFQQADLTIRFSGAFYHMPGKVKSTPAGMPTRTAKTDLKATQFAADVIFNTALKPLTWSMGISVNSYKASNTGTEVMTTVMGYDQAQHISPYDAYTVRAGKDDKGPKLGLRLGLNYAFTRHWSLDVMFQQTELAGGYQVKPGKDPDYPAGYCNWGAINPAWVQVGARYSF